MSGGVVSGSWTTTWKVHVETLPWSSAAVTVTVVVPNAKVLPDGGSAPIEGEGSQASAAESEKVTTSPSGFVVSTTTSEGQAMTGGVVSSTRTSKEQESELPASSVAVQVTVVVPSGKVLPEGGTHTTV